MMSYCITVGVVYRYRLWGRSWKEWKRFVERKREKRIEIRKAKDFGKNNNKNNNEDHVIHDI